MNELHFSRIHCPGQTEAIRVCTGWLAWVELRKVIFGAAICRSA